jgi:photosystem II stability/assembly factor-like uncharacterized protein
MKLATNILVLFLLLLCFQTANANWIKQKSSTFAWFKAVYFLNETKGWIAGSGGAFFTTNDGGKTWEKRDAKTEDTIRQIHFSDEMNGWLLCEQSIFSSGASSPSYLLKTTDGGENWDRSSLVTEEVVRIAKVFFDEKNNGYAVGESGAFYNLRAGETGWKKRASPNRYLLLDGVFTDSSHGVIVGAGGSILFTEDAGSTWFQSNVFGNSKGKFTSVFFADKKNGWTVGTGGKIFQTTSGGKTWREQRSGSTKNLTDIYFVNASEGWAIGEEGTLLQTANGGSSWSAFNSKIKHKLEKIFFVGKKGWIVGFGGTILVYDKDANESQKPVLQR